MSNDHKLELVDEEKYIFECTVCGKRGPLVDFYTKCVVPDSDIRLRTSDPFDFIFGDFKPTLTDSDLDPMDN